VKPFEVGTVDDLWARSQVADDLAIHHVPQQYAAGQVVPGYNPKSAPGIALPTDMHTSIGNLRGAYTGTARELLARDIWNLRRLGIPNSVLGELIDLNRALYPGVY
jgi:hypothetical protein